MYFLPEEELRIAWVDNGDNLPRRGHSWYAGQYCLFKLDLIQQEAAGLRQSIYCLYSMTGETLLRELALRKASELAADAPGGDLQKLLCIDDVTRSDDLQFIGRFVISFDGETRASEERGKSTWRSLAWIATPWRLGFGRRNIETNSDRARWSAIRQIPRKADSRSKYDESSGGSIRSN